MGGLCAPSSPSSAARSRRVSWSACSPSRASSTTTPRPPRRPSQAPSPSTSAPKDSGSKSSKPSDISELYKRVSQGVVFVQSGQTATGSGFVYDDEGHIVTNDHVVEGASTFAVRIGSDTKSIPAQLVGKDPSSDLAVLKVDPGAVSGGLKPLELGDSHDARAGRSGDRHRLAVRAGGHGHDRHRLRRSAARSTPRTTSRSPTRSRPTRRSTPATPAARCWTATAA